MRYFLILFLNLSIVFCCQAQLPIGRDTFSVYENGKLLKMPLAGGLNFCNFSSLDINQDGINDVVAYDKTTNNAYGRYKGFIKKGVAGQALFESAGELNTRFPRVDNWSILRDYNGDGKLDIFASYFGGIQVFKNISTLNAGLTFSLVTIQVLSNYNPPNPNSIANLLVSSVSVPAIADIDGDGDLDILTFSQNGIMIEYHKNQSKELYGHADSLVYNLSNACWGRISENNCVMQFNQCPARPLPNELEDIEKTLHAGSCLMCFDRNNDGDQDLILGDISCNSIIYAENTGNAASAHLTDTTRMFPNYPNKNTTQRIRLNSFPCVYNLDVDGDNLNDLIAAPNTNGLNFKSVWYYKNNGTVTNPDFQFVKDNLFQDEMIDLGQGCNPTYLDVDNDGKKDLIVGNNGYYLVNGTKAQLALYRNIGTLSQPAFSLVTRDYAALSTKNYLTISPTTGDIDADGDTDLLYCDNYGTLHWAENTAGAGNTCNFSIIKTNPFNVNTISSEGYPQLIDMDLDGKLDVMIGMRNGNIAYYRNTGTTSVPAFSLVTNTFGNIDCEGSILRYLNEGYAAPFFYRENNQLKLLLGNVEGRLFLYNVAANLSSVVLVASNLNNINEGEQATPLYEDIDGDGKRDLLLGNFSGGLSYFSSKKSAIGLAEQQLKKGMFSSIYPNPTTTMLVVQLQTNAFAGAQVEVLNTMGQILRTEALPSMETTLELNELPSGIYLVKVKAKQQGQWIQQTHKLIKQE